MSKSSSRAKTLATIRTARQCVGHQGAEEWAISTICQMSDLDAAEATILRHDGSESPTGVRYVMAGGGVIGSYSLELV